MDQVYFDYNASSPLAPQVRQSMLRVMDEPAGNPSSAHWAGRPARETVEQARAQVAGLLGCAPEEIVLTSGGSEADNLAIKGCFHAHRPAPGAPAPHIITTTVEHPAVVEPCRFLEGLGAQVTWLPVDATGLVDPEDLRRAISEDTTMVSIMHANGEVGTVQPIAQCAAIAAEHGVPFHTDAAQSVGRIETDVRTLGVDMLSIAGHKFGAPKGIGALYVRQGLSLAPLIHGGGHEHGRRAGTESALLAAALGAACELAADLGPMHELAVLGERLWQGLSTCFGNRLSRNGHPQQRLPNTVSACFHGQVGADLLARFEWLAASTGSACHADRIELSPVLQAMGVRPEVGMGAVRLSLGRWSTEAEVDRVIDAFSSLAPAGRARGAG